MWIEATAKRVRHRRRRTAPAPICECEVKEGDIVPSASPELNLAENAQGYLRQLVRRKIVVGDCVWAGRVPGKMEIVEATILELDANKSYWEHLFDSVQPRAAKVVRTKGALLSV